MRIRHIVVFITLILTSFYARSQNLEIKFHPISNLDGLSQNTVACIVSDRNGFLWIGTQDGLNRYDGYEFKVYKNIPSDPYSLSDNYIRSLYLDSKGNLWVGTETGLNLYDFNSEKFIDYSGDGSVVTKGRDSSYNSINVISESKSNPGQIWFGTNTGIYSFYSSDELYTKLSLPLINDSQETTYPVNAIMESDSEPGIIWIGTPKGLFRYNSFENSFVHYDNLDGLCGNIITCIFEDSDNTLWIGSSSGLSSFDKPSLKFDQFKSSQTNPYSISNNNISYLFEDKDNNLWIGTSGGGLNLYNKDLHRFYSWEPESGDQFSISSKSISAILEDRSGNLWIGTQSNGFNKVRFKNTNFEHNLRIQGNPNSISGNGVRAIMHDNNGDLWIGSEEGISILDEKSGNYRHLTHQPGNSNSLSSNRIRAIYQDKKGVFWIGTEDQGLNSYDPRTNSFKHYISDANNPNSIGGNYVRAIYEDSQGVLWVGTVPGGLNKLGTNHEIFYHYHYEQDNPNSLNDDRVYSIYEDSSDELWIGTGRGMARFKESSDNFERFIPDPGDENSICHHYVIGLSEDHNGNILIATYGGGIDIYNPDSGKFTHYDEKEGLANNSVYGIIEDKNYNLWMSTNYGISKLDPSNGQFTNFNMADGLQEDEFNSGAHYKSIDGKMYFGGVNGISSFYPDKIIPEPFNPPILIHSFQVSNRIILPGDTVNGRQILAKTILETDNINLTFRENVFTFGFVALDLQSSESIKYKYILHGFDNEWNDAGKRRYATYTSLPPGEYEFQVIGLSGSGIPSSESRSIHIIITPPWWETTLFYIILTAVILMIILLYIRVRLRILKLDKAKLEKRVEERSEEITEKNRILTMNQEELRESNATKDKFFSIIAHDLLNPFSNILGLTEILKSEYKDMDEEELNYVIDQIDNSTNLTYKLLENLLTWSRSQRGKIEINKEKYKLRNLVDESYAASQPNADKKNINISNQIPDDIEILIDKFTISIVLNNIVNNAIKFTPDGGSITLIAELLDDYIKLIIKDTGVGLSKESISKLFRIDESPTTLGTNKEKGTGLGLIICKEFVEKNHGSIAVESNLNEGSSFIITLPN